MRPAYRTLFKQAALLLLLACQSPTVSANTPAVSEYSLKSALLLKLSRFVYFPEASDQPPNQLCVVGKNPFGNTLQQLNQASDPASRLQLKFLSSTQKAENCHFIFISKSERRRVASILQQLQNQPLVTISDIHDFARSGGMIELSLTSPPDNQLNILINRPAASRQGIEFNAQLLRLATLVNE